AADWDDGAHFDEGALWEEDAKAGIAADVALSSFPLADLQPSDAPYDLGSTYWEVDLGGGADGSLEASAVGEAGADWGVVAVAWPPSGPATVVRGRGPGGAAVDVSLPLQGASRVVLGVADLGPVDMDAEASVPRRSFTLALAYEPPDPGGDDDSADDDTSPPADDDTAPPADDDAAGDDDAADDVA
ncbi:hypothetical protein L6R50_28330, partial [Myxococcota bacterium]|nr:hypothetical protein [Myxococcota bacterium]